MNDTLMETEKPPEEYGGDGGDNDQEGEEDVEYFNPDAPLVALSAGQTPVVNFVDNDDDDTKFAFNNSDLAQLQPAILEAPIQEEEEEEKDDTAIQNQPLAQYQENPPQVEGDSLMQDLYENVLKPLLPEYQKPNPHLIQASKRGIERANPLITRKLKKELQDPADFFALWEIMQTFETSHERYINVVGPVLRFLEMEDFLREALTAELHNQRAGEDMDEWIEYLKKQEGDTFHITQIDNKYYACIPPKNLYHYNKFRMAAVKDELIKTLLTVCELILVRGNIDGGFVYTHAGKDDEDEDTGEVFRGKMPSKRVFLEQTFATKDSSNPDRLTTVPITETGTALFFKNFQGKVIQQEDQKFVQSEILKHMNNEMIPIDCFKGDITNDQKLLVIPVMRSLCETFEDTRAPYLREAMEHGGCRMSKKSTYTQRIEPVGVSTTYPLSELNSLQHCAGSQVQGALFVNMVCSFTYHEWVSEANHRVGKNRDQMKEPPEEPLYYQVLHTFFDRKSTITNRFALEKPVPISRVTFPSKKNKKDKESNLKKETPQIVRYEMNLGKEIQSQFSNAKPYIDTFFKNDFFLATDPYLILYGIQPEDRYEARFYSTYLHGDKRILAIYALLSSLQDITSKNLQVQKTYLKSQAMHFASEQALHVVKPYLSPAELKDVMLAYNKRKLQLKTMKEKAQRKKRPHPQLLLQKQQPPKQQQKVGNEGGSGDNNIDLE